ncbi:MAG TPA: cytochrome c biogenesis protein CcdA [Candidatus Dormibacteraeota bacterium]|nr:cytochrome c biogenesis protein CcdA [Candidatus Dormibacteraeota bacterium]
MGGVFLVAGASSLDGISPALAVLAGLVSFVSPCVLPLVPAYLAYLGARAAQPVPVAASAPLAGNVAPPASPLAAKVASPHGWGGGPHGRRGGTFTNSASLPVAAAGLGFVAGLSVVFILFFYVFSLVVQPVRAFVPVVAGIFVIALALHVAGVIRLPFLSGEYRVMKSAPQRGGVVGGFVLGMGFASGWTPCIGVTLSAVLSSAVTAGTTAQGLGLMVAYCLGLGLPFIALAFALESAKPLVRLVNQHRRAIDLASAAVLLVMGVLLLTNKLTVLSAGISQLVPSWPSPTL